MTDAKTPPNGSNAETRRICTLATTLPDLPLIDAAFRSDHPTSQWVVARDGRFLDEPEALFRFTRAWD